MQTVRGAVGAGWPGRGMGTGRCRPPTCRAGPEPREEPALGHRPNRTGPGPPSTVLSVTLCESGPSSFNFCFTSTYMALPTSPQCSHTAAALHGSLQEHSLSRPCALVLQLGRVPCVKSSSDLPGHNLRSRCSRCLLAVLPTWARAAPSVDLPPCLHSGCSLLGHPQTPPPPGSRHPCFFP